MLTRLAAHEGQSQQALGETLGINPTRMVFLVDDLEQHELVERRRNPDDRRSNALYLTAKGRRALQRSRAVAATHEASFGSSLSARDRAALVGLLRRVATEQDVDEAALPGPPGPDRS
jgi:DNA-binding MarR family transcriptional regulator